MFCKAISGESGALINRGGGLARRNRSTNDGRYAIGVLGEIQPGEAQHLPSAQHDGVLALSVDLKSISPDVEGHPVDFEGHPCARKSEVDAVAGDAIVRLPPSDACAFQDFDHE